MCVTSNTLMTCVHKNCWNENRTHTRQSLCCSRQSKSARHVAHRHFALCVASREKSRSKPHFNRRLTASDREKKNGKLSNTPRMALSAFSSLMMNHEFSESLNKTVFSQAGGKRKNRLVHRSSYIRFFKWLHSWPALIHIGSTHTHNGAGNELQTEIQIKIHFEWFMKMKTKKLKAKQTPHQTIVYNILFTYLETRKNNTKQKKHEEEHTKELFHAFFPRDSVSYPVIQLASPSRVSSYNVCMCV